MSLYTPLYDLHILIFYLKFAPELWLCDLLLAFLELLLLLDANVCRRVAFKCNGEIMDQVKTGGNLNCLKDPRSSFMAASDSQGS